MAGRSPRANQCQNPTGWLGRLILRNMNSRHSKVTDWGLSQGSIGKQDIILDVGCGGGRTVSKLAAIATQGKVYGIDHSKESVAMAVRTNKQWIDMALLCALYTRAQERSCHVYDAAQDLDRHRERLPEDRP